MVKDKEIKKANEEYGILTGEAYERRLAYLIDKGKKDYNTQIKGARNEGRQEGRKEGRAEGREEGRQEEKEELTKRLLKLGVSMEIIEKAMKKDK